MEYFDITMRVLIVDDNVDFLATARRLLEQEGVVAATATTGDEALECAQKEAPAVILVDVELGEENGFDVVERLAAVPGLASHMVLVSAHVKEDLDDLLANSSAIGFLPKAQLSKQGIVDLLDSSH